MFESFESLNLKIEDADIHLKRAGEGPPLLMLHGFPQTHVTWHKIAPTLAERFQVIVPDVPGYGASTFPEITVERMSKPFMASLMVKTMRQLGHERFHLIGHDRGARIGYRLALNSPDSVDRIAMIDTIPTIEVWEAMRYQQAIDGYHWLLLAQPEPELHKLIASDGPAYARHLLNRWAHHHDRIDPASFEACAASYAKPSVVEAMFADYRAGASVDLEADRVDRDAGRKISAPLFFTWGQFYMRTGAEKGVEAWKRWANNVTIGGALDSGHFPQEEDAQACAAGLMKFFTS